jgi:hypothetical protein
MDAATAVAVITLGTAAIAAVVSLIRTFVDRDPAPWVAGMEDLRKEIESHKVNVQLRVAEIEGKLALLELDGEKIEEVKQWIARIEASIDRETGKLESKMDDLMKLIIENLGK